MILLLALGCPSVGSKVDTGSSAEAWPEWEEEAEDSGTAAVELPEDDNDDLGLCGPEACIELAEAHDRGFATIQYGSWGLEVENIGPYAICFEAWYTFLSETSQDAIAGTTGASEIEAGSGVTLPYGDWGTDTEAWWCVEHNQYTNTGSGYSFNGARAPELPGEWAQSASDEDADAAEDHTDTHPEDGLPQTQHNVWDYIAESPVFVVGRSMNWFEVRGGQTVDVTLEVTNLGRVAGEARVTERVPPGWVVSAGSPAPDASSVEADGGQTLSWLVKADAAVEPADTSKDTAYGEVSLRYRLTYAGPCSGREVGYSSTVLWADPLGGAYVSEGSPLIVQCCGDDDGPNLGGGGLPP